MRGDVGVGMHGERRDKGEDDGVSGRGGEKGVGRVSE